MLEQLWFRIIVYIFCLLLAFLVGCSKRDLRTIENGKQIILSIDREEKDKDDDCDSGICPPPEGYK